MRAWKAVLDVTTEILETQGYGALTVDAIAASAGVSKATIYRWWADKADVAMDAVLAAIEPQIASPDTGSLERDLEIQVTSVVDMLTKTSHGPAIAALIAEIQSNPRVGEAFRERFLAARREAAFAVLRRGRERGELAGYVDLDVAVDTLYGPVYYRLLLGHQPLDRGFASALLRQLCDGLTPRPARRRRP
jgi:AcrR family transcriptional regulator